MSILLTLLFCEIVFLEKKKKKHASMFLLQDFEAFDNAVESEALDEFLGICS